MKLSVTVWSRFTAQDNERINKAARRSGLSRAAFIRQSVLFALDDIEAALDEPIESEDENVGQND